MPNIDRPQYPGHVTMRRDGESWDCPARYVDKAREQGWVPADEDTADDTDPDAADGPDHTDAQASDANPYTNDYDLA